MIMEYRNISTAQSYEDLCAGAVEKMLDISRRAIEERGCCRMALSGGTSPKGVYALMAGPYRDRFDWDNIQLFLCDECWTPRDPSQGIYTTIVSSGIPAEHLYPINLKATDPQTSALSYQDWMFDHFKLQAGEFPEFDLILLGLGEDGHTASLYPQHPVLNEHKQLVAVVDRPEKAETWITLTLPVINHARAVLFVVTGGHKAAILKRVWSKNEGRSLPAAQVCPDHGEVYWFTDEQASL